MRKCPKCGKMLVWFADYDRNDGGCCGLRCVDSGCGCRVTFGDVCGVARALAEAIQALGVLPEGYCYCHPGRDAARPDELHFPECRDLRRVLRNYDAVAAFFKTQEMPPLGESEDLQALVRSRGRGRPRNIRQQEPAYDKCCGRCGAAFPCKGGGSWCVIDGHDIAADSDTCDEFHHERVTVEQVRAGL